MKVFRASFYVLGLSSALLLSACGEGWVTEEYTGVPYTDERTAGTGVAYVLARMAPAAGPVIEPEMEETIDIMEEPATMPMAEPEPEIEEFDDADDLFIMDSKK